ncbi:MAG: anion permease [Atopobiaceae bacterium]|jgi:di/tricarboxylate transporter|nr:anion permease [Atopobiaceae bacterium]
MSSRSTSTRSRRSRLRSARSHLPRSRPSVWIAIAVTLWLTEGITGLNIGFVTLLVGLGMAMPVIGGVLTPKSWSDVPVNTLVFLTAAMAIGTVGAETGMNTWIANVVLPANVPSNIFVLALLIAAITVVIHMFMGSVMAVLGICIPAFITFTAGTSISPLAISMMVFSAINIHYILPFHNLAILVGSGEENAGYSSKEAIRMGVPLTAVVFLVVLVEAAWFSAMGLM